MLDLKKSALQIFRETLAAIDIPATMRRKLSRKGSYMNAQGAILDLSSFERICTVAIGKASVAMAQGLAELLSPEFNAEGIVVAPTLAKNVPAGFRAIVAGHPVPNEGSFDAGRSILDFLATTNDRTLIFFLLSGGGSALVEQPLLREAVFFGSVSSVPAIQPLVSAGRIVRGSPPSAFAADCSL